MASGRRVKSAVRSCDGPAGTAAAPFVGVEEARGSDVDARDGVPGGDVLGVPAVGVGALKLDQQNEVGDVAKPIHEGG